MTNRPDEKPGDAPSPTDGDLDEALEETFPNSDPAVSTGTTGAEDVGGDRAEAPDRKREHEQGPGGERRSSTP